MKRWLVGLTVLLGWLAIAVPISGYADVLPNLKATDQSDYQDQDWYHGIATAPQGVPLDNLFYVKGDGFDSTPKLIDSPLVPKSIAQVTHDTVWKMPPGQPKQASALWSRRDPQANPLSRSDNRLNLNKDAAISLWMYFGDKGGGAADGMAFVLQNSSASISALAATGEGLGVWGADNSSLITDSATVAGRAIKKSWALEFDTRPNKATDNAGGADSFDMDPIVSQGMHIASGYPALASTYKHNSGGYFTMNHTNPKLVGNFADGTWHHLSLKWSAADKTMTYTFNDRDPESNEDRTGTDVITDSLKINPANLGVTATDGNVYWGITGATNGYSSENGFIVVDSSDSLGHVESAATLTKKDGQKISEGDSVTSGEQVTYTYTFDYKGNSQQDIHPLTMNVPLPTPLQWQSGGVSYGDSSKAPEPFSKAELAQPEIKKAWVQPLDGTNPRAVVKVTGIVPKVTSPVKVAAVTARFFGDNYQTQLSLPSYNIQGNKMLKLSVDQSSFDLKHSEPAIITGTLTDNDKPIPAEDMQDYHLNAVLNGKATTAGSLDSAGHFNFNIAPKDLKVGDNQLVLVGADGVDATADDRSHRSNAVTITIKREEGALYISDVAENSTFIPTQLTGRPQWISRQNDWRLKVMDERGANRKWTLQVALGTPFHLKDGSSLMTGDVALRHGHDQDDILKHAAVNVMSKTTTTEDEETDVLPSHWNEVEGLALHVNGGAVAGDYEGTFDWQLVDGPQAD